MVRIDGVKVASGKASLTGRVNDRVTVPRGSALGKVTVSVRGATAKRTGSDSLRVT